jgi:serine/threonine protein kinase
LVDQQGIMTACTTCGGPIERGAAFCGLCGTRARTRRTTLIGGVLDDRYRIDAKLAEGGFGSIYQATHIDSGLDVALKVLHADLAADPSLAARFRREGATLSRLHDPHTVATYEIGEAPDGTLYIAMELLRGESLYDRMTRGPLRWRDALAILRAICSSLAEAHQLGVIHRDLKPANIHISTTEAVKVLDFGIAKVTGTEIDDGADLTRMGQTIGTLEYMAPEQIIGGSCDPRSDIYQLGVLGFEMITGRRPFADSAEPTALITALLTQVAPAPSTMFGCRHLPTELDTLLLRCLEREPEQRFSSVGQLAAAIDRVLGAREQALHVITLPPVTGEEATWIGGAPALVQTYVPRVTAIGPMPHLAPTTMPSFEIPVRGSVADAMPIASTGSVASIAEPIVEPPPARRLPFLARLALWTVGLAASGAAVGALLASLAR